MPRGVKGSGKAKKPTKAKAKKAAKAAPAVRQQHGSTPANVLISLLNAKKAAKRKTMSISQEVGKQIAAAVETKYLNRKVFNAISPLWNLEPAELRDWVDVFDHYFEISGLRERAESAPPLMSAAEGSTEDGEAGEGEPFPEEQQPAQAAE